MKRNWDTIREILTLLEDKNEQKGVLRLSDFQPERAAEISYHVELLIEAGLYVDQCQRSLAQKCIGSTLCA
jgi:hypothetical protein